MASARRNELIHRLLAERCEICETHGRTWRSTTSASSPTSTGPADREKPAWMHLMAMRRRKTLVICRPCHEDIHAGRATAPIRK